MRKAFVALLALALVPAVPAPSMAEETPSPSEQLTLAPPDEAFTFTDPDIVESSGLVVQDGLFITVNDSGSDGDRLFTVDPATGDTVGLSRWAKAHYDIEGLAPAGSGEVWVGDIGDNNHGRDTLWLHRVPVGPGEREAATSYEIDYPDGNHDAEALLRHPETGRVYVVSKEAVAGRIYELPEQLSTDGINRMRGIAEVMGLATGGAFFPDGKHLMIRGYSNAEIYTWPEVERIGRVPLPRQPQGEALAIDDEGRIFLSTEGLHQPVLEITLPDELHYPVNGLEPPPEPEPVRFPEPERPLWAFLFIGAMGLAVVYGAVRLVVAYFRA